MGRNVTVEDLWRALPKAWIVAGAIAGLTMKLVHGVIWYKSNVVEQRDFNRAMAEMKALVEKKANETITYTDRTCQAMADKVTAHSDGNHADLDVKWSAANAKLDMLTKQTDVTQAMVGQLLIRSAVKNSGQDGRRAF